MLNSLDFFSGKRMDNMAPICVGDNVYIGMGAFVMPGVTIGNNCCIGAGAVVTHDIPDGSVAVGIPAKVIKSIQDYYNDGITKERFYDLTNKSPEEKRQYLTRILMK